MTENRRPQKLGQIVLFATGLLTWALLPVTPARAGHLLASGQTTAYQAQNEGDTAPVDVPDDGTLQRGDPLRYKLLKDGTVKDLNTGLIWEVKCYGCGGLHEVGNAYVWSGDGTQETIWDWLAAVNAEGGTGYARHNDWRIPNVRELHSIVDFGSCVDCKNQAPMIDPIFGPSQLSGHWTSTTFVRNSLYAYAVDFYGFVFFEQKDLKSVNGKIIPNRLYVRAVRGGPQ